MEKQKDKWDKLNAISGLVAGILVAIIGGMFTYVYRANELESLAFQHAQELRVLQVKVIQSFMTHLNYPKADVDRDQLNLQFNCSAFLGV